MLAIAELLSFAAAHAALQQVCTARQARQLYEWGRRAFFLRGGDAGEGEKHRQARWRCLERVTVRT